MSCPVVPPNPECKFEITVEMISNRAGKTIIAYPTGRCQVSNHQYKCTKALFYGRCPCARISHAICILKKNGSV